MTDNFAKPIEMRLDPDQIELTPLPDAAALGYFEVARVWRKPAEQAGSEDLIVTQVRQTYGTVQEWALAFASFAQTLAVMYGDGNLAKKQIYQNTCDILWTMAADFSDLAQIAPSEDVLPISAGGGHVGELVPADEVLENEDSVQILGVWSVPDDEEEEDGSQIINTYIQGQTSNIPAKDLGAILADVARVHSEECGHTDVERFTLLCEIELGFHQQLNKELPRA